MTTIKNIENDEINFLIQRMNHWVQTLKSLNNKIEFQISGHFLHTKNQKLDLRFANSSKEIIKIFAQNPEKSFNKSDLIYALYGDTTDKSISYQRTIAHNTIKRLSRCRKFLRQNFRESLPNVQWLYHDKEDQSWRFYHIR